MLTGRRGRKRGATLVPLDLGRRLGASGALAVTQASVAGNWEQSANSLSVASDGTLTGKLTGCTVSGTLLLATPASSKNLYTLSVTGMPSAGCSMQAGITYAGNAAIAFLPVTNSNLYSRTLIYLIKAPDNSLVAYGQFSKQ